MIALTIMAGVMAALALAFFAGFHVGVRAGLMEAGRILEANADQSTLNGIARALTKAELPVNGKR